MVQGRASRVIAEVTYATLFSQHLLGNCPADWRTMLLQQSGALGSLSSASCSPEQGWAMSAFRKHREPACISSPWHGALEKEARQAMLSGYLARCQSFSLITFSSQLFQLNGQSPQVYYGLRSCASAMPSAAPVAPCSPCRPAASLPSGPACPARVARHQLEQSRS